MKNRLKNVAVSTAVAALALLGAPALASATTESFNYTGGVQTWIVPEGVTSASFDLYGAEGGTAFSPSFGTGGLGGRTTATGPVTPGESIEIRVGGKGGNAGGYNGGGAPGSAYPGGGGGATDVRRGGSALSDRVLVAGGGGGSGACSSNSSGPSAGGAGGGLLGGDATPLTDGGCGEVANSGKGATQSAGGASGAGAAAGTLGQGGDAVPGGGLFRGGGGGGYYGGGGGSFHSGGGGGSGFGPAGTAFETGVRSGNGLATVTYITLSVTSGPTGTTQDRRPQFGFSADGGTTECSIDQGTPAFGPCPLGSAYQPSADLTDGLYTFRVRATDAAGNVSRASRVFTVDGPPDTQISGPTHPAPGSTASFTVFADDASAGFECRLDSDPFTACTNPFAVAAVTGSHEVEARAVDAAGNVDPTPAALSFLVDALPAPVPETTIGKSPSNPKQAHTHFRFRSSIPGSSFTCTLDKQEPTPCSSPQHYRGLSPGRHKFKVFATSPAAISDPTPAKARFTITAA